MVSCCSNFTVPLSFCTECLVWLPVASQGLQNCPSFFLHQLRYSCLLHKVYCMVTCCSSCTVMLSAPNVRHSSCVNCIARLLAAPTVHHGTCRVSRPVNCPAFFLHQLFLVAPTVQHDYLHLRDCILLSFLFALTANI